MEEQLKSHPEQPGFQRMIAMVERNGLGKMWMFDCWEEVHDPRRVSETPKQNHKKGTLHYSKAMPDRSQGQRLLLQRQNATELLLVGFYANTTQDYNLWIQQRNELRDAHAKAVLEGKKNKTEHTVYNFDETDEGKEWHSRYGTKPFKAKR